jgi:hypothetical protein
LDGLRKQNQRPRRSPAVFVLSGRKLSLEREHSQGKRKGRGVRGWFECSADFPATSSAIQAKAPGTDKIDVCDGFVAWFSPDGAHLEYASYVGGSRADAATAVALAPDGEVVYVAGYTASPDFPVTA